MSDDQCILIYKDENKSKSETLKKLFEIACEKYNNHIDFIYKKPNDEKIEIWKSTINSICSKLEVRQSPPQLIESADDFGYDIGVRDIEEKNGFTIITFQVRYEKTATFFLNILAEANISFAGMFTRSYFSIESFYRVINQEVVCEFYNDEDDTHDQDYYERIRQWWYSDFDGWSFDTFPYGEMFSDSKPPKSKKGMLLTPPSKEPIVQDELTSLITRSGLNKVAIQGHSDFTTKLKKLFKKRGVDYREIYYDAEMLYEIHEEVFELMVLSYEFVADEEIRCLDVIQKEKDSMRRWAEEDEEFEFNDYKIFVVGTSEQFNADSTIEKKVDGLITIPPPKTKNADIEKLLKESLSQAFS